MEKFVILRMERQEKNDTLVEGEYPVIGGGQKPMGFHNEYNTNENTIFYVLQVVHMLDLLVNMIKKYGRVIVSQ